MDSDPLEDENVAETLRTKDDEKSGDINKLVGEPTETILTYSGLDLTCS